MISKTLLLIDDCAVESYDGAEFIESREWTKKKSPGREWARPGLPSDKVAKAWTILGLEWSEAVRYRRGKGRYSH